MSDPGLESNGEPLVALAHTVTFTYREAMRDGFIVDRRNGHIFPVNRSAASLLLACQRGEVLYDYAKTRGLEDNRFYDQMLDKGWLVFRRK